MSPDDFTSVADCFAQAALLLDTGGVIRAANREFRKFGWSSAEIVDRPLTDLLLDSPDQVQDYLNRCSRQRQSLPGALTLRPPRGGSLTCRCDGCALGEVQSAEQYLVIRFVPRDESATRFRVLNQKVSELSAEITRRQQLQVELFKQRESLRVTLASIGDGVLVTDQDARITFMNSEAERLTGWTREEAAGKPLDTVFRIVHEQTRMQVENPVKQVLRDQCIVGLANHTLLIAKDGREIAIDDSAAPIGMPSDEFFGVVLVFRDVSQRRTFEISQARLAAIVDSSEDAIIGQTFEGIVTDWNQGAERLFGFSSEEVIGKAAYETFVPEDKQQELFEILRQVQAGERVEHFETVRRHKDGRRIDISIGISPIQDAAGEFVGVSAIDRDITQRKHFERSLRFLAKGSKSLATLVDYRSTLQKVAHLAVPDFADWCAVDLLADDGTLERVAVAHGDPEKVQIALEMHRAYPPRFNSPRGVMRVLRTGIPELVPIIRDSMLRRSSRDEEHYQRLRSLGLRSYMCLALKNKKRTLGVITFVFAESGRSYGPGDLELAQDLAHRATIAIENARLYEEVREADRRKDEFLAMLAHELRNPLTPIQSGLDLLAMDPAQDSETIQVMRQQVKHLVRLVDDLLDVSRIMRGRIELRKERIAIQTIVRQSVEAVKSRLERRRQRLEVSMPTHELWVEADSVRVAQILENLLTNASKYTDADGQIWLRTEQRDATIAIEVRDNGTGMEPDILPKVFDLFSQSPRTLDRSQGGLGIGLTLVRNLVELHEGTVTAHSEGVGQGSTFTVMLPWVEPAASERHSAGETRKQPQADSYEILVVDDNSGAARMLAILLERLGDHRVATAFESEAALRMVRENPPDIILLDIGLPGLNGYDVARAIRQVKALDRVLLVALTGYGQAEDRRRSKEAGFDEHLVKPPSVEDLQKILRHAKLMP